MVFNSPSFNILLLLITVDVFRILTPEACIVHQKMGPKPKKVYPWEKMEYPRNITDICECGFDTPKSSTAAPDLQPNTAYKDWHMAIFVKKRGTENLLKVCSGTLINSKIIVTSHNCLKQDEGQSFPPFTNWGMPRDHINVTGGYLPTKDDITVNPSRLGPYVLPPTFPPKFEELNVNISQIIYNDHFIENDFLKRSFPVDDVALIVLVDPWEIENSSPICVPENADHFNPIGYKGYYYGFGGEVDDDPNPEIRSVGDVVILPGNLCDEDLGYANYSEKSSLCVQYRMYPPQKSGGPLVMAADGMVNKRGYTPSKQVFLLGLASVPDKRKFPNNDIVSTYFTNIAPLIKYIDMWSYKLNATWCTSPKLSLETSQQIKKDELKNTLLQKFEWEKAESYKRDESLDCACGLKSYEPSVQARVVGGEEAGIFEFPWQVLYRPFFADPTHPNTSLVYDSARCGASIINDRLLLTAAHCVIHHKDEELTDPQVYQWNWVYLHLHNYDQSKVPDANDMTIIRKLKNIYFHPNFPETYRQDFTLDGDIALLELETPLAFSTVKVPGQQKPGEVRPICLPRPGKIIPVEGKPALVAGWGVVPPNISEGGVDAPKSLWESPGKLNKLEVEFGNFSECIKHTFSQIRDSTICNGNFDPYKDTTSGDSGGAVIVRGDNGIWTQVGIVSYGAPNQTRNPVDPQLSLTVENVALITNVQKYLNFVDYYSNKVGAKWCKTYD